MEEENKNGNIIVDTYIIFIAIDQKKAIIKQRFMKILTSARRL